MISAFETVSHAGVADAWVIDLIFPLTYFHRLTTAEG
jgi:hypothetical protein